MQSGDGGEVKLFGYQHNHGVGSRSLHIVISLSTCAAQPAAIISRKNENVHLTLPAECQDGALQRAITESLLPEIVGHPNVASALLVAAGCEVLPVRHIMPDLLGRNTALEFIVAGESNRMSITQLFGEASLSELSARSMPGFDYFTGTNVGIIHHGQDDRITEIAAELEILGINTIVLNDRADRAITQLISQGCVVILNFLREDELPSTCAIVPVISVSSCSDYHSDFSELCDLSPNATVEEIISLIKATLGRQMTKAEMLRMIAPINVDQHIKGARSS